MLCTLQASFIHVFGLMCAVEQQWRTRRVLIGVSEFPLHKLGEQAGWAYKIRGAARHDKVHAIGFVANGLQHHSVGKSQRSALLKIGAELTLKPT